MDEERKKGIRYHCDEKWDSGHLCKKSRFYFLQETEPILDLDTVSAASLTEEGETSTSQSMENMEVYSCNIRSFIDQCYEIFGHHWLFFSQNFS